MRTGRGVDGSVAVGACVVGRTETEVGRLSGDDARGAVLTKTSPAAAAAAAAAGGDTAGGDARVRRRRRRVLC